jgi:transcriptional regulator GlxA family with amidase domain
MKAVRKVSVLLPEGAANLNCIEGSVKAFETANVFLLQQGEQALFELQLVALSTEPRRYDRSFIVEPDCTIATAGQSDLIIIPPVNGAWKEVIHTNAAFYPWICQQYAAGAEVASLCVGAFLLASTGLINGKRCSTHWLGENDFRLLFPEVELVADKIITDEKGIYSSGGAISYWNLLLYLISKYTDRHLAVQIAKYFEIEIDRYSQASFIMFRGQKEHEDEQIKKAQEFIENNVQERLTVEQLADMFSIGRRSLERRFKKATNNTVVEYIQRVKIEAAKKSFETSAKNVSEVMYDVGYNDNKSFRTVFRKIAGLSPLEYRNRYNNRAINF